MQGGTQLNILSEALLIYGLIFGYDSLKDNVYCTEIEPIFIETITLEKLKSVFISVCLPKNITSKAP